jgi:hypothetical protein
MENLSLPLIHSQPPQAEEATFREAPEITEVTSESTVSTHTYPIIDSEVESILPVEPKISE